MLFSHVGMSDLCHERQDSSLFNYYNLSYGIQIWPRNPFYTSIMGSTLEIILFIVGCEWYPLELCSACVAASKGWEYVYKLPP